jgi:hypothetical protein
MITESELTTAQKYLWVRAQEEMEECGDALFLAQSLLRSAPEFLEARRLARNIAMRMCEEKSFSVFEKIKRYLQLMVLRGTIAFLIKRKHLDKALLTLEYFLATAPFEESANRLMATVAERWNPPLLPLALFALETALIRIFHTGSRRLATNQHEISGLTINHETIELHLEIARVALLFNESGVSWNPERALTAYQQVLSHDPHHLEARQGLKNTLALLSMRNT